MSNSKIKKSSIKREVKTSGLFHEELREEYRAWFLIYLDAVEKLLELEEALKQAERMGKIFENGRTFGSDAEIATAVAIGDFLHHRYEMKWSINGFREANKQLETEFSVTKTLEKSLWKKVLEVGKKAWYDDEASLCRLSGAGVSCTQILLTTTSEAECRVRYYKQELSRKAERLISPDYLEIKFHSTYGELLRLAPIAID
ncbi:hypothetical protein IKF23_02285 [Candidatus Saccharibacteria bacterium]|nr:hypothetical protein [Candidatus Saccharibacteria bacterium]